MSQPQKSALNVIIVEDEIPAQKELRRQLLKLRPEANILAVADSIESAAELLATLNPDLVFMDIQLADGQSFEIFTRVEVKAPVVFITAYDAYALQAFKSNGIDYLLKPLESEALEKALHKFENLKGGGPEGAVGGMLTQQQLQAILDLKTTPYKTRFMISTGDRIRFVPEENVAYFRAEDEAVFLVTPDRKRFIINYTLEALEPILDPRKFFRINRSYITSISAIADIHKYFNSRLKLALNPDPQEEVLVSRSRVPHFLQWIDQ